MGGGAERVPNHEERHIFVLGSGVNAICLRLHHVAVGQDDFFAVEGFLARHVCVMIYVTTRANTIIREWVQIRSECGKIMPLSKINS